jgi:hypothetical protein
MERKQSFPQDWELLNAVERIYDFHFCSIDTRFFYNQEEGYQIGLQLADYWHETYHGKPELYELHNREYHDALVD